jgi:PEP-CTERM/exosortase A-associated glycosyltransferase
LEQQRKFGWETFHLTSPKHDTTQALEEEIDGLHFFRTPVNKNWFAKSPAINQLAVMYSLANRLNKVIEQVRPHLLHAHSPVLNALPALRIGHKLDIPVVYEVRAFWEDAAVDHGTSRYGGPRYRATKALETYALRKADAITTICHGLQKDMVERGIAASKITVIPNAVDVDKFHLGQFPDAALKHQLGLDNKKVIGFIGSFYAYEGLTLLLKTLPGILQQMPDVRVLLVGGGASGKLAETNRCRAKHC